LIAHELLHGHARQSRPEEREKETDGRDYLPDVRTGEGYLGSEGSRCVGGSEQTDGETWQTGWWEVKCTRTRVTSNTALQRQIAFFVVVIITKHLNRTRAAGFYENRNFIGERGSSTARKTLLPRCVKLVVADYIYIYNTCIYFIYIYILYIYITYKHNTYIYIIYIYIIQMYI